MPDPQSPGFEGPEKKIEIEYRLSTGHKEGLFNISDETWQKLLDFAKVTIIGKEETKLCKMYVLSESSLFVYRKKLVIKTCGTTTLLDMVPPLQDLVSAERNEMNSCLPECLALETEYMSYSRKNYLYPEMQPHRGKFPNEVRILEELFPGGGGYVLGPINKDHWNFFLADYTFKEHELTNPGDQTLEVIMTDLDPEKMAIFFNEDGSKTEDEVTTKSGIDQIIPGSVISAKVFDPCGYSMNGLCGDEDYYWTIHVTPETHCSFVSFETSLPCEDYSGLISRVLNVFGPKKTVVTLFADDHSSAGSIPREIDGMKVLHRTKYDFDRPYRLRMVHLEKCTENGVETK